MKIAFFSESEADEAALKILVAGILGEEIEKTNLPNTLEYRSSSHLDKDLPAVITGVHYTTDAEALIVVSDSDDTPVHTKQHEKTANEKCRLCQLRKAVDEKISKLRKVTGKEIIKIAIGIPVPAIEAWYLLGKNPSVFEATWIRKQQGEKVSYDRIKLKEEVYETSRPSKDLETEHAVKESKRIIENGLLGELEKAFPCGFGTLANEVRSWKR
ncbi:MAG: hypothetical protein ACR2MG_13995 [Pyrinomonadaceae bacterium]